MYTTIFTATAPIALDMIACVLVAGALLPVHESACAKNQTFSVRESVCKASPSCFQYDWDETGDAGSLFKNLSNAMCVSCVPPRGLLAKKGCDRFTASAARLCCVSAHFKERTLLCHHLANTTATQDLATQTRHCSGSKDEAGRTHLLRLHNQNGAFTKVVLNSMLTCGLAHLASPSSKMHEASYSTTTIPIPVVTACTAPDSHALVAPSSH